MQAGRDVYDYVIVGGGSAGCVLAARLSEAADVRVLLLEAGPADRDPYIHIPAGYYRFVTGAHTWGYRTVPQAHLGGRELPFSQARVIGGGSSINAQVFVRGCPEDYDRWAEAEGCPGWSFADIRHCFVRMEDNDILSAPWHGNGGPLGVTSPRPHLLTRRFVQACQQAGIAHTFDFNGARQDGAGVYQTTTRAGRRCSTADGYLRPARTRANLKVAVDGLARRILIDHGRAVGVEFSQNGTLQRARAEREVIVCAGAIGSPKLLLLSGIGPADALRRAGVDVTHELPGVGMNLQDHYAIDIIYELSGGGSLDRYHQRHWRFLAGLQYLALRDGPAASNVVEGGAFLRVDANSPLPDTQLHFVAGAGVPDGVVPLPPGRGCVVNSYMLRPLSRGSVTLRGADPAAPPLIDPNYLAEPEDVRVTREGLRRMREIMAQPAFAALVRREYLPGTQAQSDAALDAFIRAQGRTGYHPVGTCRMGQGGDAVVDPQLRVHGLGGLRVCDSSIMPRLVSSNTNAPTIMIAERASEFIRGLASAAWPAAMPEPLVQHATPAASAVSPSA
jgi:choline dehydrogenase